LFVHRQRVAGERAGRRRRIALVALSGRQREAVAAPLEGAAAGQQLGRCWKPIGDDGDPDLLLKLLFALSVSAPSVIVNVSAGSSYTISGSVSPFTDTSP
jgi:hypothetical protein